MGEVFARRASGLVREATLLDTVLFGIMNNGAAVSVWYYLTCAPYMYPGVNHAITFILAVILVIFGFCMVWGILGAAMPRSGGEYVYNTRIIHPAIGTAVSLANAGFVMTAWIWVLTPWIIDPGLSILAGAMGLPPETFSWALEPATAFALCTIINFIGFLVVVFGLRVFFWIQRIFIGWSLVAVVIAAIIFSMTPHSVFVSTWNHYAHIYNSLTWEETLKAVNKVFPIPKTWRLDSSVYALLPLSWGVVYGYVISFIGGEVKSPRRNIFIGQVLNALVMLVLTAWVTFAEEAMVGWDGLHALAWIDNEGLEGYNFPWPPTFLNIASMLTGLNPWLGAFLGLAFIWADFMWIPFSYIAFSRDLFAWGMDRVGPMWFVDINPRFHSPVKLLFTEFILGEIGLVWYILNPTILAGFSVEVMQLVSVFGITSISAIIFPFRKKVKHIWDASPHKEWKIGPIPYCTIAGILSLILVVILVWADIVAGAMAVLNTIWFPIYVGVWILGVVWYYAFKWYRAKEGIDITLAYKELAPE